jgi:hypothetical protein
MIIGLLMLFYMLKFKFGLLMVEKMLLLVKKAGGSGFLKFWNYSHDKLRRSIYC